MTVAMYEITVPVFTRTLTAQARLCQLAADHCAAERLDRAELIFARLAADMQPFAFQFAAMINNWVAAVARLRDEPTLRAEPAESFAGIQASLAEAIAWLNAADPDDLIGSEHRQIVLPHPRGARHFDGLGYLTNLALPGFFFHAATAYDILRHKGLQIGKRDYLGALPARQPAPA